MTYGKQTHRLYIGIWLLLLYNDGFALTQTFIVPVSAFTLALTVLVGVVIIVVVEYFNFSLLCSMFCS